MTWESIRADVRLALRQCRRAPLFAVLTVASLALGIGANSAMFGVVQAVLLRAAAIRRPRRADHDLERQHQELARRTIPCRRANYEAFKAAPSLAGVEGMYSFLTPVQIRVDGEPEPVIVSQVTPGMFSLLGRTPLIGRKFDDPGAPPGAVHQLSVLAAAVRRRIPPSIGQTLSLSAAPAPRNRIPIIGVMPQDFTFPYGSMLGGTGFTRSVTVDMWWPMSRQRDPRLVDQSGQPNRGDPLLRRGRTAAAWRLDRSRPRRSRGDRGAAAPRTIPDTNAGWGVTVRPLHEQAVGVAAAGAADPARRRRRRAADHLHQRRERAARALRRPRTRSRDPLGARRLAHTARSSRRSSKAACCRSPVGSSASASCCSPRAASSRSRRQPSAARRGVARMAGRPVRPRRSRSSPA